MIAYFVIFALCGVIIVQAVIYYRKRLKLYSIIHKNKIIYNSRDEPKNAGNETKENVKRGHKRSLARWRNGGDDK